MSHQELVDAAICWLRCRKLCNPVFSGNSSCREVPDAIGWTSVHYQRRKRTEAGSHIVECKCSVADFRNDRAKYLAWKVPQQNYLLPHKRLTPSEAVAGGYELVTRPRMGDWRWFLCAPGIITPEMLGDHPNHGLLYREGKRIHVIVEAERRDDADHQSEVKYLRFAIVNRIEPHTPPSFYSLMRQRRRESHAARREAQAQ